MRIDDDDAGTRGDAAALRRARAPFACARAGPAGPRIEAAGRAPAAELTDAVAYVLRLDEDLSPFYARRRGRSRPRLGHRRRRASRPQPDRLRGGREDDLHDELRVVGDGPDGLRARRASGRAGARTRRRTGRSVAPSRRRRRWPAADLDFYRDDVRAGYRGAYLRSLAESVASGELDLEALGTTPRSSPTTRSPRALLALPGVGPYAAAHVMMLLGRYSRLVLDSWTRPTYARLTGGRSEEGHDDRAALPALRAVRRARVLARAHARLGRRGAE